ncbi:MAG TPA: ATP-binding protein [Rugosibacter sp.]|nr:ATP-binding protein [Rugosibacter sp.]HQN46069.1 ATP-binding protein [Rugosibacter sp.]HQQ35912.1 ATP-binding protein [Rugosibacter sp.]
MNTIPLHESLTCEFNSDRQCLSDKDLIEEVVCMANCQGGEIYLGVEEDGTVTGLRAFEWVETLFKHLKTEQEFQSGLFRVAVPKVDHRAFREAIANAITSA